MVRYPVCLFLVIASVAVPCWCELFSSMAHLQSALYAEKEIASEIRGYVLQEKERLSKLEAIAEEFESHSSIALKDPDFYLGNPVNAYLFVKHFTLDWDRDIEIALKNNSREDLNEKVTELKQYLPTYEDLTGSVNALLRLQDTYKLDTTDIAQGNVGGTKSTELSVEDCFVLGRVSYHEEDYYHTVMWMGQALTINIHNQNRTVNSAEIIDYLAFAEYKQGNIRRALSLTEELLTYDPDHGRAHSNKAYYEKILKEEAQNSHKRGDDGDFMNKRPIDEYRSGEEFQTYEALCRGENIKKHKYIHKLVCRYRRNKNHPLLMLAPAKEEEIYKDPYIVLIHDAITDTEISLVKTIAIPKLGRATVHNPKTGKLETATYRVSKSCWLSEFDDGGIAKLNSRIEAITGLDMTTAEELQVANYGLGGQYEPHFDFARKEEPNAFKGLGTGNRIATFMFYMSDVQAGGATVFPYLGLKIFPQKGTAVFWYNLYKNGEGIYNTRHAACPVLVGSKWVSNKWIHERGQEFRRQCGLTAEE